MRAAMRSIPLAFWVMLGAMVPNASAQQPAAAPSAARTATGVVVSASRVSLVLRSDDGQYSVFAFDRDTVRPATIPQGARVRVVERTDQNAGGIPVAESVVTTAPAEPKQDAVDDNVPPAVRRLERRIQRESSRYRIGGYGAVAIDPELVTIGARGTIGPIFDSNAAFRPNIELGFGEITTLLGVNLDGVYYFGRRELANRWTPYVGGGVNLSFRHEDFNIEEEGRSFDFGDFDLDSGVNFIAGLERNNVFLELVSTAYAIPHVRFIVGVNFW